VRGAPWLSVPAVDDGRQVAFVDDDLFSPDAEKERSAVRDAPNHQSAPALLAFQPNHDRCRRAMARGVAVLKHAPRRPFRAARLSDAGNVGHRHPPSERSGAPRAGCPLVLAFFVRSDLLESELAERCDEPAFADPSAERIKALERFDAIVAGTSIDECVERSYGIHRHPPSERESGAP